MKLTRTEIDTLGEFGLINHLTKNNPTNHPTTLLSIGDDAAIINHPSAYNTVISTDLLIEEIHFDLSYTPLKHLGYKAVSVNVSDIYAMNATPTQITVSIALSNRFSVEAISELYEGIYAACRYYHIDLIGGDTTSSNKGLILSITAIGMVEKENAVTRSTAHKGDLICLTGDVGAAYMGLLLLQREKKILNQSPTIQPDLENRTHILEKILKPTAQKETISSLKLHKIKPTSMIDVSDGLSSEILHLCHQSQVGCVLYEEKIPIHPETKEMANRFGISATTAALSGGEDYELLFTIAPSDFEKITQLNGISIIGHITQEGYYLVTSSGQKHELIAQGWKHLQK